MRVLAVARLAAAFAVAPAGTAGGGSVRVITFARAGENHSQRGNPTTNAPATRPAL